MSSVAVGDAGGVATFADPPDPSGGPAVLVSGSVVFAAGGTVFLDIEPEPGAAVGKLLVAGGADSVGNTGTVRLVVSAESKTRITFVVKE